MTLPEVQLDPVPAYDRIAPGFAALSDGRRAYLTAIEQLVVTRMPPASHTLLDVGAGDGTRAVRIARAAGIDHPVLLEPSAAMRAQWPAGVEAWAIRAEELSSRTGCFDAITCLWNVLGHIFPEAGRVEVLRQCARLLAPDGRMFIDVSYRYNAAHYGLAPTALRALHDVFRRTQNTGDVVVRWNVGGSTCVTAGHVFTDGEFRGLVAAAGLRIEARFTVDYASGRLRRWPYAGNPLYVLQRPHAGYGRHSEPAPG